MQYHKLKIKSHKKSTRVGRGISAGKGKTAGRGTKGQNSRTGGGVRPGFEGGQNPLAQRLPKLPGFKSKRPKTENIYTGQLDSLKGEINNQVLADAGLVSSAFIKVKLISKGEVTKKHKITIQAISKTAKEAVEKAGGEVKLISRLQRNAKEKTTD